MYLMFVHAYTQPIPFCIMTFSTIAHIKNKKNKKTNTNTEHRHTHHAPKKLAKDQKLLND